VSALDVLLVLRKDGALLPVYRGGLCEAEGWPWTIKRRYTGALVFAVSGAATMTEVDIVGLVGRSTFSRFLSALNSNWTVSVRLNDAHMVLKEIIDAVSKGLRANISAHRALFDIPESELLALVQGAESVVELFHILGVDRPDFVALDRL
jgi:hypothetical protein